MKQNPKTMVIQRKQEIWKSNNKDFPGGADGKVSACNAGDTDLIPRLGRSLGEGNGNPLQYSYNRGK